MKANLMLRLIQAHADGDHAGFKKAALRLAANESNVGHLRVAEKIRAVIEKLPAATSPRPLVNLAQPRGELSDLLYGGYPRTKLTDIVLGEQTKSRLVKVLKENRSRNALEKWGVAPTRRVLFCGPPGCGKTLAANVVAGELGTPLMTIRFDGLFSRYLGATASHLKAIFDEMPKRPAVYLFDEFDAVAKYRGDAQEVGEVRRVVTSFLQLMDADESPSIIIAATNYGELLDRAVFRRFDEVLTFPLPEAPQAVQLISLRLKAFKLSEAAIHSAGSEAKGLSFADIGRACDDAIRTMVLADRNKLVPDDLETAIATVRTQRVNSRN